jgi:hypothetical protein
MIDFIKELPKEDAPEMFCLNKNAEINGEF